MKLAMCRTGSNPVAVIGEEALRITALPDFRNDNLTSIADMLGRGPAYMQTVERAVRGVAEAAESTQRALREQGILQSLRMDNLQAPFPQPALLFFTGGNYKAHLDEIAARTGMRIEPPANPIGFIKNSHTVIGHGDAIVLPDAHPDMIDFEVEFSFVIGRSCHAVSEAEARSCIAGYTVVNDISARDWNEAAKRPDGSMDLSMPTFGKQFPTFCPMGPLFVTADEIPEPGNVDIQLTLNGQTMQQANTGDLLFSFERILSYFSQFFRFMPGDVLTTGSPPGVGFARQPPVFLRPGDVVAVSAAGIGTLQNPVAASRHSAGYRTCAESP